MKIEKNFKYENMLKFTQFCKVLKSSRKSAFLKSAIQAFEAGDVLHISEAATGGIL